MEEIRRPEGVYGETCNHFYIQCACGSGKGARYKSTIPKDEDVFDETEYNLEMQVRSDIVHYDEGLKTNNQIYYTNVEILDNMLWSAANKNKLPLVLVCNDCKREFNLTPQLFKEVVGKEVEGLELLNL